MTKNAVVLVADAAMFPPAAFLAQRLALLRTAAEVDIILISDSAKGLDEARRLGLTANLRKADFSEVEARGRFSPTKVLPAASYYRIGLPRLLAGEYSRILYVDADTFPLSGQIFELFKLDLKGNAIAASRALSIVFNNQPRHRSSRGGRLLNSGVLLIDTAAYVRGALEERMWEAARRLSATPVGGDQLIFNHVLAGEWLELSPTFNMNFRFAASELAEAFSPAVFHFIGRAKQWSTPTAAEGHPARTELAAFLARTAWADFLDRSRSTAAGLKRTLRTVARRSGMPAKDKYGLKRLGAMEDLCLPELLFFLRTTEFADVAQGLATPDLRRLP